MDDPTYPRPLAEVVRPAARRAPRRKAAAPPASPSGTTPPSTPPSKPTSTPPSAPPSTPPLTLVAPAYAQAGAALVAPTAGAQEAPAASQAPAATPAPEARPKRRLNTSSKGAKVELEAIKLLEAEGYRVHRCVRTGAKRGPLWISQSNDVFGCIDLVAKRLGERTRWIQVTADGGIGRKRDEILGIPWDVAHDSVEIWRWVGGQSRRSKVGSAWLERQYFQVYVLETGFALEKERRVHVSPMAPTPGGNAT